MDGNKGLWNAVDLVWPNAKKQRCIAHKIRIVSDYVPKKMRKQFLIKQKRYIKGKSYDENGLIIGMK